jgi:Leucine-rich repeat (LRR) protein
MALKNPKLFGLNVLSFLSEIPNKTAAVTALGLSVNDLAIIRGSANAGATRADWNSFSRLKVPIYKALDRYLNESAVYLGILNTKAGTTSPLFGNLILNGGLSGYAIRYRFVSGTGPSAVVKIADISTSRLSAWSSFSNPVTDSSPIAYGAQVGIRTGGQLEFGTPTDGNQIRLQTSITPAVKEFASEFPTSKINCTIGGKTVTLYAMKGIPLIFEGFFRSVDATIRLTSLISNTPASWKIYEIANPNSKTIYRNRGGITSTINYRSSVARARYIEFYYNPDYISQITLTSANLTALPESKLQNLTYLNVSFNNISTLQDLTFLTPNLQRIYFIRNPLYLSAFANERNLNANVLNKLPTSIIEFGFASTFYGSIPVNALTTRFPNLVTLNLSRNGTPYFHPDSFDPNGYIPNVPNSCEYYNIYNNDFRSIAPSSGTSKNVKELTNLKTLYLHSNYYLSDPSFNISADNEVIQTVNIDSTNLPCPNLSGRQSLVSFSAYNSRSLGSIFDNGNFKFAGCGSLRTLQLYYSSASGPMPKFTNNNLTYFDAYATRISGGDPNGDTTYVIPEKTFEFAPNISFFRILSNYLLYDKPIHPSAFTYLPNLDYVYYYSYYRTPGQLPNFNACTKLRQIIFQATRMTGNIPNFAANPIIYYVLLAYNSFSGAIPTFKNLSNLRYMYLYNNRFTGIGEFQNLVNLEYFYAHNNLIQGEIPSFAECPRLYYLIMYNNQFTNYKIGAFAENYRLRYVDLSRNRLSAQAVNAIINDLFINYTASPRSGVTLNLRSNAAPSGDALDQIDILRSKGWSISF